MNRLALLPLALLAALPGPLRAQPSDDYTPPKLKNNIAVADGTRVDRTNVLLKAERYSQQKPASPALPVWPVTNESWPAWKALNFSNSTGYHTVWCRAKDCDKKTGTAPLYILTRTGDSPQTAGNPQTTTFTTELSQFTYNAAKKTIIDPRDKKEHSWTTPTYFSAAGSVIRVSPPTKVANDAGLIAVAPDAKKPAPVDVKKPAPSSGSNQSQQKKKVAGTQPEKKKEKKEEGKKDPVGKTVKTPPSDNPTQTTAAGKELSPFETTLQTAMQKHSKESAALHAEAVKNCEPLESRDRAVCWRPYLKKLGESYAKEQGPAEALSPLEQSVAAQMVALNPKLKDEYDRMKLQAKGNPAKNKEFVEKYRGRAKGAVTGYLTNGADFDIAAYAGSVQPMDQANEANDDPENRFDARKPIPTTGNLVVAEGDSKSDVANANAQLTEKNGGRWRRNKKTEVPKLDLKHGPLKPGKEDKKDDPNKWNDTIAGAKGTVWLGLVGGIFGGPVGLVLFGAIGFGMMYGISKMNNS